MWQKLLKKLFTYNKGKLDLCAKAKLRAVCLL